MQCVHDTTIFVHHVNMIMDFRNPLISLLATPLLQVHLYKDFLKLLINLIDCLPAVIEVKFEQDSYMGEEGSSVIGIKLQATDFVEPFKVRIFTFPLDADAPEKKVEAEISKYSVPKCICT